MNVGASPTMMTSNQQVVGSIPIASSNGCMFILYKNILNYLIMPGLAGEVKLTMESSGNRQGQIVALPLQANPFS